MAIDQAQVIRNDTRTVTPQCKVVVYPWTSNRLTLEGRENQDSVLTRTTKLDVSSKIVSFEYSKTLSEPSGSFSFVLSNSVGNPNLSNDWKDVIPRGSWCVIYLTQDGDLSLSPRVETPDSRNRASEAKKIRCIGYVDRVAVRTSVNDKGAFDVSYEVSGRDFGVVYEDTNIWVNTFQAERAPLDAIAKTVLNPTGLVSTNVVLSVMHQLFYNPEALDGDFLTVGSQWLLPSSMLSDVGLSPDSTPYWGELGVLNFSETACTLGLESPSSYLNGNAWSTLKRLSVPEFHELFTETSDNGVPRLNFRPMPFAINKSAYSGVGKFITLFKDLESVTIDAINVLSVEVGEDNQNRWNSFLVTTTSTMVNNNANVELLRGTGFPRNNKDSIKRHGFRPMHVEVEGLLESVQRKDGQPNLRLLRQYNEVLYDYHNNSVFFESGTASIIGQNDVKVGKAVKFKNVPYSSGKKYYLEGYSDSFTVGENGATSWTQTLFLSRGVEESDLRDLSGFGRREEEFDKEGEYTPR